MDEVATSDEVLLVEIILQPHVLHVHLTIGVAHINLTFPLTVGEAHADTHVGDADTAFQRIFLMLGIDVGCIEKDTARRFSREFRLFLSTNGSGHCHRHH